MTAERLREAARVLREGADAATPGPWRTRGYNGGGWTPACATLYARNGYLVRPGNHAGMFNEPCDAAYIATVHPGVGLALADWLDAVGADEWAHGPSCLTPCDECDDDPYAPHARRALRVADLILGGES